MVESVLHIDIGKTQVNNYFESTYLLYLVWSWTVVASLMSGLKKARNSNTLVAVASGQRYVWFVLNSVNIGDLGDVCLIIAASSHIMKAVGWGYP